MGRVRAAPSAEHHLGAPTRTSMLDGHSSVKVKRRRLGLRALSKRCPGPVRILYLSPHCKPVQQKGLKRQLEACGDQLHSFRRGTRAVAAKGW